MRRAPLALLMFAVACCAAGAEPPKEPPIESPVGQLRLAVMDLATKVSADQAPYQMYLSFATVPAPARPDFRRVFRMELNKRNGGRSAVPEVEIDGPRGTVQKTAEATLIRIDIQRAPNWTRTAWNLVADRDYLFRETPLGLLPHRETTFGRIVTGREVNPKTLAAGFVVNAFQLFRDMIELDRSQTGHDLLYAAERHPDKDKVIEFVLPGAVVPPEPPKPIGRPWPGGYWKEANGTSTYYPPGAFTFVTPEEQNAYHKALGEWALAKKLAEENAAGQQADPLKPGRSIPKRFISIDDAGKGIKDFPAKLADFQKRWGGRARGEKVKEFLFDPTVGGIALAFDSDERLGSYVAVGGDRLIEIEGTEFGFGGTTRDSFKSTNGNDQIERENFVNAAKGKAKFDGGESLYTMPIGAQAEFLFNGQTDSVTIANTNLARITNPKIDTRYQDVRVGFCQSCHGPNDGYNPFVEQFRDSIEKGVKFNVQPEDAQQVTDFFLSWERQVKRWKFPYAEFLDLTTRGKDGKPWTGQQAWLATRAARDAYDKPVGLDTVAFEFGVPVEALRRAILGKAEPEGHPDTRLNQLAVGKVIPRRTYETDVAGKLAQWLDAHDPPDPLRQYIAPQLLEDALKQLDKVKFK